MKKKRKPVVKPRKAIAKARQPVARSVTLSKGAPDFREVVQLIEDARKLPEEPRLPPGEPTSPPGERKIGTGERGGREVHRRYVAPPNVAHIAVPEVLGTELAEVELALRGIVIIRPDDGEPVGLERHSHQADPREELGYSHAFP